jgi:hypothetical protein
VLICFLLQTLQALEDPLEELNVRPPALLGGRDRLAVDLATGDEVTDENLGNL